MGKKLLGNAFSLGMLDQPEGVDMRVRRIEADNVPVDAESVVGHADTAALFSSILGREVLMNRASTSLAVGDELFVGQYNGPRLQEGATSLPPGATIRWLHVSVHKPSV